MDQPVNEYLGIVAHKGRKVFRCRCGHILGPARENFKLYAVMKESPIQPGREFLLREFYCPSCFILLETEVARRGEPLLWSTQPKV